MSTRRLLEASWRATQRQGDEGEALTLVGPSVAGLLLECTGGDVAAALARVPRGRGGLWERVAECLEIVEGEERGEERRTG